MCKAFLASSFWLFLVIFLTISLHGVIASSEEHHVTPHVGPVVERDQRRTLFDTEYGEISSIDIKGGHRAPPYHLQFFTLEPNSVFLPVLLHANMVFYVHTGSGRLTWTAEDGGTSRTDLREGDIFKLSEGSVFYIQSNLEAERKKLRIYAIFANTEDTTDDPPIGAYSRINELVKGFNKKIIQAAFKVPEDLIEAITNRTDTPAIVHANSKEHRTFWELEALGIRSNVKKGKTYNIFDKDPDFKNCHGWSLTVTKKQLKSLKGTNTGFLMVNLTTGSMLGPHWNPSATEIAVVLEGEGMVRVVCASSNNNEDKMEECTNMRFKVKQGDVFVVPRFHPMAQMSFNNDSLVFLGFSTAAKENYPQFLAGKRSMLGALDRHILATSFGVTNTTIDQLFASQDDSIIFGCVSCAEEEERMMQEEIGRKKKAEEEERKREEEESKRKEEEARKREERKKRKKREVKKRRRKPENNRKRGKGEEKRRKLGDRKKHRVSKKKLRERKKGEETKNKLEGNMKKEKGRKKRKLGKREKGKEEKRKKKKNKRGSKKELEDKKKQRGRKRKQEGNRKRGRGGEKRRELGESKKGEEKKKKLRGREEEEGGNIEGEIGQ